MGKGYLAWSFKEEDFIPYAMTWKESGRRDTVNATGVWKTKEEETARSI